MRKKDEMRKASYVSFYVGVGHLPGRERNGTGKEKEGAYSVEEMDGDGIVQGQNVARTSREGSEFS